MLSENDCVPCRLRQNVHKEIHSEKLWSNFVGFCDVMKSCYEDNSKWPRAASAVPQSWRPARIQIQTWQKNCREGKPGEPRQKYGASWGIHQHGQEHHLQFDIVCLVYIGIVILYAQFVIGIFWIFGWAFYLSDIFYRDSTSKMFWNLVRWCFIDWSEKI